MATDLSSSGGVTAVSEDVVPQRTGPPASRLDALRRNEINTDLLKAILKPDTELVRSLLKEGASVLARCRSQLISATHLAALRGEEDILRELIASCKRSTGSAKTALEARDSQGRQPHHLAAAAGQAATLRIILEELPDLINSQVEVGPSDYSEEHLDSYLHNHSEIDSLVTHRLFSGSTVYHIAARFGYSDCIDCLEKNFADLNILDDSGYTPLDVAGDGLRQQVPFCGFPLSPGASPFSLKFKPQKSSPPTSSQKLLKTLNIKQITDIFISLGGIYFNNSPVHKLVQTGTADDLKELLDRNDMQEYIGWKDDDGQTALHIAVNLKKIDHLNVLLEKGKDFINEQDSKGRTALLIAVDDEWVEGIRTLVLNNSCLVGKKENVFHAVARKGNENILKFLLTVANDEVSHKNIDGYTPLGVAIMSGHITCVNILLSIQNAYHTQEQLVGWAIKEKTGEMLKYLNEKHLVLTTEDFKDMNALYKAVEENNIACLKYLLSLQNSEVLISNCIGLNPLILAARNKHYDIVKELLKNGSNLAAVEQNKTAVDYIFNDSKQVDIILDYLFDLHMMKDTERAIRFDFLLADARSKCEPQLGVVGAFSRSKNEKLRKKFFLHPLVESFLYFKWKSLKPLHYLYLSFFIAHILFNTLTIISIYIYHNSTAAEITRIGLVLTSVPVVIFEVLISELQVSYLQELESWVKWTALLTGLAMSCSVNSSWARPVASVSVLAAWMELLYLFVNTPFGSLKLLMFFHVTKTVFKVLGTFIFLIVGFALSFAVLFDGSAPFEEMWPALSQTVAMMSELGYNDVFQSGGETHPLARPLFLLYLFLVGTVLSNLLVGMSVSDVAELESEGRAHATARRAQFLVAFEKHCYQKYQLSFLFWIYRRPSSERRLEDGMPMVQRGEIDPREKLNAPTMVGLHELPTDLRDRLLLEMERREEVLSRLSRTVPSGSQGTTRILRIPSKVSCSHCGK